MVWRASRGALLLRQESGSLDASRPDGDCAITFCGERAVVGHQHERGVLALSQGEQQVHDCLTVCLVQISGWFVGDQDIWSRRYGSRKSDPLLLAAG